jgi:tRNA (guanine37-N1)-methyltransferase
MSFRAIVLTLFPEMFPGPLGHSLAGKALARGDWSLETIDIREFATDRHRSVDDAPYGGGPGMVMRPDVVDAAVAEALARGPGLNVIVFTPRGRLLTQKRVRALAEGPGAILLCGRYEGIDERVIAHRRMEELSIGDYVLSGGEPAAMVLLDACVRLLPGVMGTAESSVEESFASGLLEYPQYTRPAVWQGMAVPEVLAGGDHAAIAAWRREEAERATRDRRPDLWAAYRALAEAAPTA